MGRELPEVRRLRLKLKAARALIRDLAVAAAQAEEALQKAHDAQPDKEGTAHEHEDDPERYAAVA